MDSVRKITLDIFQDEWGDLDEKGRIIAKRCVKWCIEHQAQLPAKQSKSVPSTKMLDIIDESLHEECGIHLADLQVRNKRRTMVDTRDMVMLIYRNKSRVTLDEVGELFGLHHSTAIHGINNAKFLIDFDQKYNEKFHSLKKTIDKKCDDYLTSCGAYGSSGELF